MALLGWPLAILVRTSDNPAWSPQQSQETRQKQQSNCGASERNRARHICRRRRLRRGFPWECRS
jgi:hypothetical protein